MLDIKVWPLGESPLERCDCVSAGGVISTMVVTMDIPVTRPGPGTNGDQVTNDNTGLGLVKHLHE